MKTHDFRKSIKVGEYGEALILDFLKSLKNISEVEDVTGNYLYQDADVDFLVHFMNGNISPIEIKTDTYTSGNIFYETVSNLEAGTPGCMEKTQAQFLFYYFTETRELYIMNMPKYREWFHNNITNFDMKRFKNINRQRNGTYTSIGYTVPKIYLENNFREYKKYVL